MPTDINNIVTGLREIHARVLKDEPELRQLLDEAYSIRSHGYNTCRLTKEEKAIMEEAYRVTYCEIQARGIELGVFIPGMSRKQVEAMGDRRVL